MQPAVNPLKIIVPRRKTSAVKIGDVPTGSDYPVRLQSMTNTDPMDTAATVKQVMMLADAGFDYVRLTVPNLKSAENLAEIKRILRKSSCRVPLIADVHFNAAIAIRCASIVEKVRINPGNYAGNSPNRLLDFTEEQYLAEVEKLHDILFPLIKVCRDNGTALRIGTNHGSLSERIMTRYGDTIEGMTEATLEYVRACRNLGFDDLVLSIKSSNPVIMADAYRALVVKMNNENMDYPLHIGVTEAGEGEDGVIKSTIGSAMLLNQGLADTIRVSLAGDPLKEYQPAKAIASLYHFNAKVPSSVVIIKQQRLNTILRRDGRAAVIMGAKGRFPTGSETVRGLALDGRNVLNMPEPGDITPDYIMTGEPSDLQGRNLPAGILSYTLEGEPVRLLQGNMFTGLPDYPLGFIALKPSMLTAREILDQLKKDTSQVVLLDMHGDNEIVPADLVNSLGKINNPVVFCHEFKSLPQIKKTIEICSLSGALLADGWGEGICFILDNRGLAEEESSHGIVRLNYLAFSILQSAKRRIFRTEYVICPTCGRTRFDLQKVSVMVKSRTSHLKGLKIGIMGCIVNGLGEMGDADYGFIGSGKGKVSLYRNKEAILTNIALEVACDELINLIKLDGKWVDPPVSN